MNEPLEQHNSVLANRAFDMHEILKVLIQRAVKPRSSPSAAKRLKGRADGFGRGYKALSCEAALLTISDK